MLCSDSVTNQQPFAHRIARWFIFVSERQTFREGDWQISYLTSDINGLSLLIRTARPFPAEWGMLVEFPVLADKVRRMFPTRILSFMITRPNLLIAQRRTQMPTQTRSRLRCSHGAPLALGHLS